MAQAQRGLAFLADHLSPEQTADVAWWSVFALIGGAPVGLGFGSAAVLPLIGSVGSWLSFVVARVALAVRSELPVNLMRFLDDAYRRGVLRQTGAVYQFRHARRQQHLATSATKMRQWRLK